jgi:hypothetical protein
MSALQQHMQAVAEVNLKQEFLSGAGCASFLLLEDSDIEDLLQEAGRPSASNSAAMEQVQQVGSGAEATGFFVGAQTVESMQLFGQMVAELPVVQACPDGITVGLEGSGREIALQFQPAKRRCLDDLKIDRHRMAAKRRPLDDLQLDKKRVKASMSESALLVVNASIACTVIAAESRATDAPT